MQRHPELKVLWVSPPVDIARSSFNKLLRAEPNQNEEFERLWTLNLVKPFPNIIGSLANQWIHVQQIRKSLNKVFDRTPFVWVNDQNVAKLLPPLGLQPSVYDITDDWTAASLGPRQKARTVANDCWMIANTKKVIVCSPHLEKLKRDAQQLRLVTNGVDAWRYHPDNLAKLDCPADVRSIAKPIIGYTGTLHTDRLNEHLVVQLAKELPHLSFVFVGPNSLDSKTNELLSKFPNIFILGAKSYEDLPSYVGQFDICLVPHRVNAFTDSLDPLKLYEYFATGKPIVSTKCAGFRDFPELVYCAEQEHMKNLLERTLSTQQDPQTAAQRIAYATANNWTKKVEEIEIFLGEEFYK